MAAVKKPGYASSEDAEQEAVVEYCDLLHIPIVHIPNEGKRSLSYAARMKRMGLRSGFPDLLVPLARGGYRKQIVGEWIKEQYKHKNGRYFYYAPICSICRDSNVDEPNFCPNCGAYMKGGAE